MLPPTLIVTVPGDAMEGDGTVTATIAIPTPLGDDLVIQLSSSDPLRASVPVTLTIPAGQTSATLPIAIVDNTLLDGPKAVVISATAADYVAGASTIAVHDNETAAVGRPSAVERERD